MKLFQILIYSLLVTSCQAQEPKLLINQTLISDFSNTPIYDRLIEKNDGKVEWKPEFEYLDSIEIFSISYLSDGLRIDGLLVQPRKKDM